MQNIVLVFVGSGIGGVMRYLIHISISKYQPSYIGTLLSNIIACFIIGLTIELFLKKIIDDRLRILIAVGICGGLSTFSSYSYEIYQQINHREIVNAVVYSMVSFVLCLVAVYGGTMIVKSLSQ